MLFEPVADEVVGQTLRKALDSSRFLNVDEVPRYFSREWCTPRYEAWVADMLARLGLKTKRALFKGLLRCNVERLAGRISIVPMMRQGREAWVGLGDPTAVVLVDEGCTDLELGQAGRLALSRCVG